MLGHPFHEYKFKYIFLYKNFFENIFYANQIKTNFYKNFTGYNNVAMLLEVKVGRF